MEKRMVTSWFIKSIMYFLHLLLFVSYKKLAINMFKCSRLTCIDYRKVLFILHCVICVCIQSYSGPHFPAFGLNTERYSLSLRIQIECGKMRTRITPNTDTFHAVNIRKYDASHRVIKKHVKSFESCLSS